MKTALATLEGTAKEQRSVRKRDALLIGRFLLDVSIHLLAITINPLFILLKPVVALLWPSGEPNVWDQVRSKVKELINQKMNEAYANDLQNFLTSLKKELDTYNDYADTSSQKLPKIISIDTSLGMQEEKFMNKKDPVSTLTYYVPYVGMRLMVNIEAMRIAKTGEKQAHVKGFLILCKRHIPFLGQLAYVEFEKWRRSQITCKAEREPYSNELSYEWEWSDAVTGASKKVYTTSRHGVETWCKQYTDPVMKEANDYVSTLRVNLRAWATMFNKMAMKPLAKGLTTSSTTTTAGKRCKFPFTYRGNSYSKCTSDGHTQPWCYDVDGGWGNCAVLDLTSCKMPTNSNEQYFGRKTVTEAGKTCASWSSNKSDSNFPMDGNSATVASNTCRRLLTTDYRPWCYDTSGSWGYRSIKDCDSTDWA